MSFCPVKILAGSDVLLVEEAAQAFRVQAIAAGHTKRLSFRLDGRSRWDAIESASQALDLFGDRQFLELRLATTSIGAHGAAVLPKLVQRLLKESPTTALLVILPALDGRTRQTAWVKALQPLNILEEIAGLKPAQLPAWIAKRLGHHGLVIDRETALWISERVEGNLVAAHQEIEKLALVHEAGTLSLEKIRQSVTAVSHYDGFQWREALLAGDAIRISRIAHGLRHDGEATTLVLWGATEELRLLQALHEQAPDGPRSGNAWNTALRAARIWPAREGLYRDALRRLPRHKIDIQLCHAHAIDRLIKGLAPKTLLPDAWTELLRLGLSFV